MADLTLTEDKLAGLEEFQALLPDVRHYIYQHAPLDWTELMSVLSVVIDEPLGPLSLLPLASCAAVGGNPRTAIPLAAAWEVLHLAMRILDDLQDRDCTNGLWAAVGLSHAFNYSAALYTLCNELLAQAPWSAELYRTINQTFTQAALRLLAGQDRDLRGETRTLEDYWRTIEGKNAMAFSFICAAGAICGTEDAVLIEACRTFGHHLGLALQLFDDFEGLWEPSGLSDLAMGKITLPIIYGISVEHEERSELQALVNDNNLAAHADRIRTILDKIHTRDFMIWAALQERKRALASLTPCQGQDGVTVLNAYVTTIFANIKDILSNGSKL
jgi:geranylgeranyl diphosphate synthase type I